MSSRRRLRDDISPTRRSARIFFVVPRSSINAAPAALRFNIESLHVDPTLSLWLRRATPCWRRRFPPANSRRRSRGHRARRPAQRLHHQDAGAGARRRQAKRRAYFARRGGRSKGCRSGSRISTAPRACARRRRAASSTISTPTYESTVSANLLRDGAVMLANSTSTNSRWLVERDQRLRPVVSPWRRKALMGSTRRGSCRRLVGRFGGGGRGALVPWRDGDRHRRLHSPAGGIHRHGRIKPTYGRCSRWGIVASLLARSGRADYRTVRDAAIMRARWPAFDAKDTTSVDAQCRTMKRRRRLGEGTAHRRAERISARRTLAEIAALWEQGVAWLKDAGADIARFAAA